MTVHFDSFDFGTPERKGPLFVAMSGPGPASRAPTLFSCYSAIVISRYVRRLWFVVSVCEVPFSIDTPSSHDEPDGALVARMIRRDGVTRLGPLNDRREKGTPNSAVMVHGGVVNRMALQLVKKDGAHKGCRRTNVE